MASDGEGHDYGARPQFTPINKKNPLDNIQVSLLAKGHTARFNVMVKEPRGRSCLCPSSPCGSPIPRGNPGLDGGKYQHVRPPGAVEPA